jgi:hypothetical protein
MFMKRKRVIENQGKEEMESDRLGFEHDTARLLTIEAKPDDL